MIKSFRMLIKVKLFIEKSIYIFKKRFRYEMIKICSWLTDMLDIITETGFGPHYCAYYQTIYELRYGH